VVGGRNYCLAQAMLRLRVCDRTMLSGKLLQEMHNKNWTKLKALIRGKKRKKKNTYSYMLVDKLCVDTIISAK